MEIKDENYDIRQVHFFNIIESHKWHDYMLWNIWKLFRIENLWLEWW